MFEWIVHWSSYRLSCVWQGFNSQDGRTQEAKLFLSLSGHKDQANLTTAKEWKVFYSFIIQITAIFKNALLAAAENLN